jgi:hypothetical protein
MNINSVSPLDRAALTLMGILMALTVILLAIGDRSAPYIREFSWKDRPVGAEDTAFALRFSRSMNRAQVESRLTIKPNPADLQSQAMPIGQILPGKVSWSGKKMLYTLNFPVPYGNSYELKLQDVKAANNSGESIGRSIEPFTQTFTTRAKMFGYIGAEGVDRGRLMIQRFPAAAQTDKSTKSTKSEIAPTPVTPADLLVKDFRFMPAGAGVFFSALPSNSNNASTASQQIYRSSIQNPEPKLVVDSKDYQNIRFDLSADGKTLVVHRVGLKNPSDFGIWVIDAEQGNTLQRISQGGSFKITPDSASIAVSEGQGVALKPLIPGTDSTEFMAKYGQLLSFSPNGGSAALEKYNDDSSRDLFLVTNQGVEKKLLNVKGEIQAAQFAADGRTLYAIVAETPANLTEEVQQYSGQPYLMAINLTTFKAVPILKLHQQQGISMSISPDGRSLLFDQLVTGAGSGQRRLTAPDGQEITQGKIWSLALPQSPDQAKDKIKPQMLPMSGFYPRWAP